jgi:hypothetical protein
MHPYYYYNVFDKYGTNAGKCQTTFVPDEYGRNAGKCQTTFVPDEYGRNAEIL